MLFREELNTTIVVRFDTSNSLITTYPFKGDSQVCSRHYSLFLTSIGDDFRHSILPESSVERLNGTDVTEDLFCLNLQQIIIISIIITNSYIVRLSQ